jgi:hypothetical protein
MGKSADQRVEVAPRDDAGLAQAREQLVAFDGKRALHQDRKVRVVARGVARRVQQAQARQAAERAPVLRLDLRRGERWPADMLQLQQAEAALNSLILPLMPAATTVTSSTKPKFFRWSMRCLVLASGRRWRRPRRC